MSLPITAMRTPRPREVIAFVLLSGYMPFSGSEAVQTRNISTGWDRAITLLWSEEG